MTQIVVAMVVIVLVAGVVVAYVAFPHRGEDLPGAPWLGRLMRRGARSLPTVEPEPGDVDARRASARYRPAARDRSYRPNRVEPGEPAWIPSSRPTPVDRPTAPERHRRAEPARLILRLVGWSPWVTGCT